MGHAEVVATGRTPAEVRLRLGVVCGALAVVDCLGDEPGAVLAAAAAGDSPSQP